jgi:lambda family phage tail tape measure protein
VRNGMHDYVELVENTAAMSQRLFVDAFQGMEDALVKFVKSGKLEFRDLVDTIETDVLRLLIRQQITGPLAQMMGGAFGSAGSLMPGFGALGSSIGSGLGSLGFTGAAGGFARCGARIGEPGGNRRLRHLQRRRRAPARAPARKA